jgi:hypothetical protein
MGARLRSITRPIHWSLLLKPLAVAAAWLFLPGWAFFLIAVYCYFVPFFKTRSLIAPFIAFMALGFLVPTGIPQAMYGAVVFALILGIKYLVIVNRQTAYEALVFLLAFAGSLVLFHHFSAWARSASFAALAAAVLLWAWLVFDAPERSGRSGISLAIAALLIFEVGVVIFFLPLSFFAQAALLFFGSALLFETVAGPEPLAPRQLLLWSGTYAIITFAVVFLAPWKI